MKKIQAFLLIALLLLLSCPRAAAESVSSTEDYIRLHILADDNSAYQQGIKLAVRDAVRKEAAAIAADCSDSDAAWQALTDQAQRLQSAAQAVLDDWDSPYSVSVEIGVFPFPDRIYGDLLVPAGDYRAVRLILGRGKGKNWWCVLYPSLCLPEDADRETPVVFYSVIGRWLKRLFGGRAS